MLETFVLLAWIYVADGEFEILRRAGMMRSECVLKAFQIEDERGVRACCFSDPDGPTWSPHHDRVYWAPVCAHGDGPCAWPTLPGRRRV